MNKKYIVRLTDAERKQLKDLVNKGKTQAYRIKHANILLAVDADGPNWADQQTAVAYRCNQNTVRNVRQRFVEQGLEEALNLKKRQTPPRQPILDGEKEARLIALACRKPPQGRAKWTLKLLAQELVALDIVESISDQTVRRKLKKMNLSHICGSAG
jgi:transposase